MQLTKAVRSLEKEATLSAALKDEVDRLRSWKDIKAAEMEDLMEKVGYCFVVAHAPFCFARLVPRWPRVLMLLVDPIDRYPASAKGSHHPMVHAEFPSFSLNDSQLNNAISTTPRV